MNIYLTTDTHFGHKKMEEYCFRPKGFEEKIAKSLRRLKEDDILIHLGDICIGSDEKWHAMYISTLPCKKILVKGNHDRKSNAWYLEHGWDFVCDRFDLRYRGVKVVFSHQPIDMLYEGELNVHGHFHDKTEEDWQPGYKSLSLERNNYQMYSLKALLKNASPPPSVRVVRLRPKVIDEGKVVSAENLLCIEEEIGEEQEAWLKKLTRKALLNGTVFIREKYDKEEGQIS